LRVMALEQRVNSMYGRAKIYLTSADPPTRPLRGTP
jgi:hypothetical protein